MTDRPFTTCTKARTHENRAGGVSAPSFDVFSYKFRLRTMFVSKLSYQAYSETVTIFLYRLLILYRSLQLNTNYWNRLVWSRSIVSVREEGKGFKRIVNVSRILNYLNWWDPAQRLMTFFCITQNIIYFLLLA